MEKLSGIIPSSARTKSVDMSDAKPVRPGAPAFGRQEGRNTIKDRVTLSGITKEEAFKETMGYKNPKEARQAKMVEDLSKKFFETRVQAPQVIAEEPVTTTEDIANTLNSVDVAALTDDGVSSNEGSSAPV